MFLTSSGLLHNRKSVISKQQVSGRRRESKQMHGTSRLVLITIDCILFLQLIEGMEELCFLQWTLFNTSKGHSKIFRRGKSHFPFFCKGLVLFHVTTGYLRVGGTRKRRCTWHTFHWFSRKISPICILSHYADFIIHMVDARFELICKIGLLQTNN